MGTVRGPRVEDDDDDDDELLRKDPYEVTGPAPPRGEDGGFRWEFDGMTLMLHRRLSSIQMLL